MGKWEKDMKTWLTIRDPSKKWICPKCVSYKVQGHPCFMNYDNVSHCTLFTTMEDLFKLIQEAILDERTTR